MKALSHTSSSDAPELGKCSHRWSVTKDDKVMVWELRHKSSRFEVVCRVSERDLINIGSIIDLAEWWVKTVHDEELLR